MRGSGHLIQAVLGQCRRQREAEETGRNQGIRSPIAKLRSLDILLKVMKRIKNLILRINTLDSTIFNEWVMTGYRKAGLGAQWLHHLLGAQRPSWQSRYYWTGRWWSGALKASTFLAISTGTR